MSEETLKIYAAHLTEQMGENAPMSEPAILDPSGTIDQTIYGIFDENVMFQNKDSANVYQKNAIARFIVSSIQDFDIYLNKELYIHRLDRTFKIEFVQRDNQGVQILWLV